MKKMKDLAYHYGLKMRIYPSSQQKEIIKINSDVSRAVYNKLVAIDKELYLLRQVKLPIRERLSIVSTSWKNAKALKTWLIIINICKTNASTVIH